MNYIYICVQNEKTCNTLLIAQLNLLNTKTLLSKEVYIIRYYLMIYIYILP